MPQMLHGLVALLGVLPGSHADVVKYTWDLREWVVDYLRPTTDLPNVKRRMPYFIPMENKLAALLANGSFPGPAIEAYENDTVEVTILNNLMAENVAIHWHGLHQIGTPWMDGVHGVSQGPILPGGNFTYRFSAYPAGTHFWHAHYQAQQSDRGLKGPIIVRKRNDPYQILYSEERVVALSDAWPNPEVCLRDEGAEPGNPVCAEIKSATYNGQYGNGTKDYPWPLIEIESGKCYRMRFIGMMGQAQNFQLGIAGHSMKIIGYDGTEVEPVEVSQVNLHAGERIDAIVCGDQPPGHYLVNATYDLACPLMPGSMGPIVKPEWWRMPHVDECAFYAYLKYKGSSTAPGPASPKNKAGAQGPAPAGTDGGAKPRFVDLPALDLNFHDDWRLLVPREPKPEPETPSVRYVLQMGVKGPKFTDPSQPYAMTYPMYLSPEDDLRTWMHPKSPLIQTLGECGAEDSVIVEVPSNATSVELVLNNVAPTAHVLHLHGMRFKVLNTGRIQESWCSTKHFECFFTPWELGEFHCPGDLKFSDPDNKDLLHGTYWGCAYNERKHKHMQYDLNQLMEKDMISVWRRGWAVIRVENLNPGMWMFHCHMEQHIPTGQMMVLSMRKHEIPPLPKDFPLEGPCPAFSQDASMLV